MEQNVKKEFIINIVFILTAVGTVLFVSKFLLAYLLPFVFGVIIAYIMQRPARKVSAKTKIKSGTLAAVFAAATFAVIAALAVFAVTKFAVFASELTEELPKYIGSVSNFFGGVYEKINKHFERLPKDVTDTLNTVLKTSVTDVASKLTAFLSSYAAGIARRIPSVLVSSIVTVVASCYIAKDFDGLVRFLRSMISEDKYASVIKIKDIFTQSIMKFALGYLLLMLITFAELLVGFIILRIKFAPVLAAVIAVIDILPILGTGTVLVPWGLIQIAAGNAAQGAQILVLYFIITVIRNFLEPKIIGGQIGINPLLTLISMFIGLKLFGLYGVFLVPVAVIITVKYYKSEMIQDNPKS